MNKYNQYIDYLFNDKYYIYSIDKDVKYARTHYLKEKHKKPLYKFMRNHKPTNYVEAKIYLLMLLVIDRDHGKIFEKIGIEYCDNFVNKCRICFKIFDEEGISSPNTSGNILEVYKVLSKKEGECVVWHPFLYEDCVKQTLIQNQDYIADAQKDNDEYSELLSHIIKCYNHIEE